MKQADAIVIGSGQGGVPLSVELAKSGKQVVLFERGELGGSCINYGCTPSKSFLAAAHNAGRARLAKNVGVRATAEVDFPFVMNRLRGIRQSFRDEIEKRLSDAGAELIHGEAAFTGERVVAAGDVEVTAPVIVINTGTSATIPKVAGLADTPFLTNKSFFDQTSLPKRFLVLGGGYIGLELGQGMARAGSKVTIFHNADRVLNNEEADVSARLQDALREDGIDLQFNAGVSRVSYSGSVFSVEVEGGKRYEGEQFLVATGRTPNTAALHCERSGIELDQRGFVKIDEQFRTTCKGVYAIADAAGQPAFTHVSWEDYRRMADILKGGSRTRDDRVLGYAVFTEPQVGRAGLTYDQAIKKGVRARKEEIPLSDVARAIEWGQERGFYRMVVDGDTDRIIGATLVGYEAAEIVHVFIALMQAGSTWKALDESVHIHPTYCEGLPTLARMFEPK
ncbi:MAG TPA: FAD-dependent oxidoreductase [Candidatus Baltobacteraceae bacterium]|nr:FAD-dependent oxidoreductase [Candidatus Baltobacteraceae bacterium]